MSLPGPDDPMFKKFQKWFNSERDSDASFPDPNSFSKWEWPSEYDRLSPTGPYESELSWYARAALTFAREILQQDTFTRGDYRELAEILNIVLGGEVSIQYSFMVSECYHIWEL